MRKKDSCGGQGQKGKDINNVIESLLKSEISFWQDLIRYPSSSTTAESLERMNQALALAQRKLEKYTSPAITGSGGEIGEPSNVYRINPNYAPGSTKS